MAIRISTSPFIHFRSFSLRHLSLDYSLRSTTLCRQSSVICACFSPQSRPSTYCNPKNIHTSCRTAPTFLFGLFQIPRPVPTPLSTLVHIPSKRSRQCRAWTRHSSGVWEIVRRSQFGSCRRTVADSLLDLDVGCVLVVDDRCTDLICFVRYGSFLEWFERHKRVYFLYSMKDLYKDMADDGDVVFFLFSGTCYVARVGLS